MTEPIWSAIAAALRAEIADGTRGPGDRLPTEAQLAARFGVNRHTVRRSLAALSDEGLVRSRRGAGVFVAAKPATYPIGKRARFHRNLEAEGRLPGRRMTVLERRAAREVEAKALGLSSRAEVIVNEGVSLADGHPVALYFSVYPAERLPGIEAALREETSVTVALGRVGVTDYIRTETRITADVADAAQAALLETDPGAALIVAQNVNATPGGVPVQYGLTRFLGERVTLSFDHS